MPKRISIKIILLTFIMLDILFFILFGNGIRMIHNHELRYIIESFGYCTLLNLLGVIGLEIILFSIINLFLIKKYFTIKVDAICLGNRIERFERDNTQTYTTSWKYEYNGKIYVVKNSIATNIDLPKSGTTRKLYINPNNQNKEYYDPIFTRKFILILLTIGVTFLLSYIGMLNAGIFETFKY